MNWDDLRFLAVIGREGTLAAASRRLAVDQTTVARRLRALEADLGAPLFQRHDGVWQPTEIGLEVLARAGRIEEEVDGLTRAVASGSRRVQGLVRITAVSAIVVDYLVPRLPALYARHPELSIDLIESNDNLNVARREADIAIRLARPATGDFLIRKLAESAFAIYGANPVPQSPVPDWVAYNEELDHTPEMRWLALHRGAGSIRLRCNSLRGLGRAIADGLGRGLLPCFIGDHSPGLARLAWPEPPLVRDLWLLVHRDARRQARVAAVMDWLVETFAADAGLFRGGLLLPSSDCGQIPERLA